MIKANIILDYHKWKNKIKDPNIYLKKKLSRLSKIPYFKKKNKNFLYFLPIIKKWKFLI